MRVYVCSVFCMFVNVYEFVVVWLCVCVCQYACDLPLQLDLQPQHVVVGLVREQDVPCVYTLVCMRVCEWAREKQCVCVCVACVCA